MTFYGLPTENKNNSPGHFQQRYSRNENVAPAIALAVIIVLILILGALS